MAEMIVPKCYVGPPVTQGKVYWWFNFKKFASNKFDFHKILEIHEIFSFFYHVHREKVFTIVIGNGREAPESPLKLKPVTSIDCIFRYYFWDTWG